MYEIPRALDWSFMMGKELVQVCYGKYQTQLRFEREVTVSIEANVEHRSGEKVLGRSVEREQDITSLILLLGASIERVAIEEKNTLVFMFSNGQTLKLFSDESPYEAFSISAPGEQTIVV